MRLNAQRLAFALAALASLAYAFWVALPAGATTLTVNITNGTVYISLQNLTVISFATTQLRYGYINETHIVVAYVCAYQTNITDCVQLNVTVYNATDPVYIVDFTNVTAMKVVEGLAVGAAKLDVSGFTEIKIEAVNIANGEKKVGILPGPSTMARMAYMSLVGTLVSLGLLLGFAAHGSLASTGVGLILFGVSMMVIQMLGLPPPPNTIFIVTFTILTGIIIVWLARRGT